MIDKTFIDALASKSPTPGGGGASAYVGALAASLGLMVGNLTVGKKKYADVEADVLVCMERLEGHRLRLLELIDEDARVFEPLSRAYSLPTDTPEDQWHKQAVMQQTLTDACDPPLAIMEECLHIIREAEFLADAGSRLALSDVGVSVVFAKAAVQAASLNVYINVASMTNEETAQTLRDRSDRLIADADVLAEKVYSRVMTELKA